MCVCGTSGHVIESGNILNDISYTYTYTSTYTSTSTYTYIYMHTYIHTYIHTYVHESLLGLNSGFRV